MLNTHIFWREYSILVLQLFSLTLPTLTRSILLVSVSVCVCVGGWEFCCRHCSICISFPQRPVGRPRAVYLSGYKAASQRLPKRDAVKTEVGVEGTGCH